MEHIQYKLIFFCNTNATTYNTQVSTEYCIVSLAIVYNYMYSVFSGTYLMHLSERKQNSGLSMNISMDLWEQNVRLSKFQVHTFLAFAAKLNHVQWWISWPFNDKGNGWWRFNLFPLKYSFTSLINIVYD